MRFVGAQRAAPLRGTVSEPNGKGIIPSREGGSY